MRKLIIVLAFTTLVAFASAHRPIITTTTTTLISSVYSKQQCSQKLQGQKFNQCQNYIIGSSMHNQCCLGPYWGCYPCMINEEGVQVQVQGLGVEECCNELKNVEEECQCEAMQEVYKQAQQQQWSQQSSRQPKTQDLQQIVQNLGKQCNLQVKQCQIPSAAMF